MRKQKVVTLILCIFMLFNSISYCYAQDIEEPVQNETTNEEEATIEEDDANHEYNTVISDYANDVPYYDNDFDYYDEIPTSFQLDKSRYPDVRDQGSYGTCWSFAALGLSEFSLINKSLADKNIDLSELQLAYFVYNSAVDPLGGTIGDQSKYYKGSTSYSYLDRGGTYEYAVRRLSQWSGAVNENDVPYNTSNINDVLNNGLSLEYAYSKDVAHLENAYVMSLKNNTNDVKRAIMNNGAVGVQYYHSDTYLLWNSDKQLWTYYDPAINGGGHNVMIVGWDDNFSRDNFVGDKPENDGAWLIRNSWGFQQSYFWMSYENKSLLDAAWAFEMDSADNYDNSYQLDGGIDSYNVSNTICQYKTYSNVFTVQNKDDISSETLRAVSLSFTHVANVNYKVEVYTDLKNNNPYSGIKQESATIEGTTSYAGLYTIQLNDEIELKPGSSFAIVVTTDIYALDYEQGINWEIEGTKVWDAPVSLNSGKSFYGNSNYQWAWYWGNFCIKAFTTNNYKISKDIGNAVIAKNFDFTPENPSITVTYEGVALRKDVDYTVSTTTDEYGTDITITGIGDYTNAKKITFISINSLTIKCKDAPYTGGEVEPEVVVTNDLGTTLVKDKDYTLAYSNNINVGEDAKVTITGINNYYGSKDIKFQIYNDIGEQLKGFNLGLDGVIEFNVYIKMNSELANDPNAYVLFTLPDNRSTVKQYVKDAYVQEEYGHMFTCGVYAQEITKKVSFQVFNGDGVGGKIYYRSVEDYTNTSLNSDKEHSVKVRPLIKALLNYGGYSQNLFNYNLEDMAYKNIKDELQTSMDNVTKDVLSKYKAVITGEESGVTKLGLSLSLDAATTLRYYFQIDSSIDISKLDVTVDGNHKEFAKDSNGYYLEVPYISSNKLDIVHTFQVGNLSIKCSALTYAYSSLNNNTNPKGMLVSKALYLYSEESKAYTG